MYGLGLWVKSVVRGSERAVVVVLLGDGVFVGKARGRRPPAKDNRLSSVREPFVMSWYPHPSASQHSPDNEISSSEYFGDDEFQSDWYFIEGEPYPQSARELDNDDWYNHYRRRTSHSTKRHIHPRPAYETDGETQRQLRYVSEAEEFYSDVPCGPGYAVQARRCTKEDLDDERRLMEAKRVKRAVEQECRRIPGVERSFMAKHEELRREARVERERQRDFIRKETAKMLAFECRQESVVRERGKRHEGLERLTKRRRSSG
ncbi:hypothetical protein BDV96DRAFT_597058 [Lophiotrema nucula]|uniref:Uncharacterized protein n=1 Tax=Lophiotrema nucula TaxID=690887 RepID=A0A6A5ZHC7_9PLEO|nr:hypothetical protein BDV96DRAFT_597058 [Lophiotrema nucula]